MTDYLNVKEAAEFLGIHAEVLRKKAALGEIPAHKLGTAAKSPWRFSQAELNDYLKRDSKYEQDKKSTAGEESRLMEILRSTDDLDHLANAIYSLGLIGCETAACEVRKHLESPFEEIQRLAALYFIQVYGIQSRTEIFGLLESKAPFAVKYQIAAFFANREKDQQALQFLKNAFKTAKEEKEKRLLSYALLALEPELVLSTVRKDLTNANRVLRYKALLELRKADYPELAIDLESLLEDKIAEIRAKAAEIAGQKKQTVLLPRLTGMISTDSSNEVKRAAALAVADVLK